MIATILDNDEKAGQEANETIDAEVLPVSPTLPNNAEQPGEEANETIDPETEEVKQESGRKVKDKSPMKKKLRNLFNFLIRGPVAGGVTDPSNITIHLDQGTVTTTDPGQSFLANTPPRTPIP